MPADLEVFAGRVERADLEVKADPGSVRRGLANGALVALRSLPESPTYHVLWLRVMNDLAKISWQARGQAGGPAEGSLRDLHADALSALIRLAPGSRLPDLKPTVLRRFSQAPVEFRGPLHDYATQSHTDELALVIEAARLSLAGSPAVAVAATAIDIARQDHRRDPLAFESATLAGTLAADHPGVADALEAMANDVAEALLRGEPTDAVRVWFSGRGWQRFGERMLQAIRSSEGDRDRALTENQQLRVERAQLQEALRLRTEALSSSRAATGTSERSEGRRVAASALRPVAQALADSFESKSLTGLQDALATALGRARIRAIGRPGEVVQFDPTRHRWVGAGDSTDEAMILSPGFAAKGEGEADEVVLVPARVVDIPTGR
jgi:hypothetical protein